MMTSESAGGFKKRAESCDFVALQSFSVVGASTKTAVIWKIHILRADSEKIVTREGKKLLN